MKKHKHIILFTFLFSLSSFAFAQAFDDMAYSNPDMATYFQQEMTSLMRFQSTYNLNVPFFLSFSGRFDNQSGDSSIRSLYSPFSGYEPEDGSRANFEMAVLTGFQFKLNDAFYLPVMFCFETASTGFHYIRDITYKGNTVKEPLWVSPDSLGWFLGSGLFINIEKIKLQGGIYMGWSYASNGYGVSSPSLYSFLMENEIKAHNVGESSYSSKTNSFKIALVPLVNTSEWKYIGKALNYILGYFGLGDALMNFTETDQDSKSAAGAAAINAALDFTFNRIHWGNLSLDMQAMYTRGNFDSAAKADTYGAKVTGLFSNFPFGFTLEGGYKHFISFASPKHYFANGYPDGTGYFDGSIYFPLKRVTFGVIYKYDSIYKSQFGVALSTNTFSGFGTFGKDFLKSGDPYGTYGLRFRWNGWKAGANK